MDELLLERIKNPKIGTYGAGIGVHGKPPKRRKVSNRKDCNCGGTQRHKNRNSKYCLINKKRENVTLIDELPKFCGIVDNIQKSWKK